MYYKQPGFNDVRVYMKHINIYRIFIEGMLIAEFLNDQVIIKTNSNGNAIIDASPSKDNGNLINSNFSFSWECSLNFP